MNKIVSLRLDMAKYQLVSDEKFQQKMTGLPLPTAEQYERFAAHLMDVHSWYKHLSLRYGGHFIVFLHSSAGVVYPTQHPSLPFGNHTEGYRKAFGHLSYMYVSNAHRKRHYSRDDEDTFRMGEVPVPMTSKLLELTSFELYPYINHNGFDSIFNGYSDRQQDLQDWHNGVFTLPDQALFSTFVNQRTQADQALHHLNDDLYQIYTETPPALLPDLIKKHPSLEAVAALQEQTQQTYEQLQRNEYDKIMRALDNLQGYLK
jgi:hypothetical protein